MNARLHLPLLALLLALAVGCAHGGKASAPGGVNPQHQLLEDKDFGFALELPAGRGFRPSNGQDDVIAAASDGTSLRLFPEFFAKAPTKEQCWERLLTRLPVQITNRPSTAAELARRGPEGLVRADRKIHLAPFPRDASCLVLVVEGPADSRILAETAPLALSTFRPTEPAPEMKARLAYEAGVQLSEMGEHPAALARFEEALRIEPAFVRAHLGAGLSAFFAGDNYMPQAIKHLETALSARESDQGDSGPALSGGALRDAIMYLGLAYAQQKDFGKANGLLAELANRFPDDPIALYNFACVLALSGDAEEALAQLQQAFGLDPQLREHAQGDEDLASLRARPEWKQLVAGAPTSAAP